MEPQAIVGDVTIEGPRIIEPGVDLDVLYEGPPQGHCGDPGCSTCLTESGGFWVRGEYLLWWVDGFPVPPLLTTSPPGTDINVAGHLDQQTTTILFGNSDLVDDVRSGGRGTVGYWFDPCQTYGIQATYFGLARERSNFATNSQQNPILARPFFNVEPGFEGQDAELIAFPDVLDGNAEIHAASTLQGVDVLFRRAACRGCNYRVDLLAGWRYNRLDEELHFNDFKRVLRGDLGLAVGTELTESDWFTTRNRFNGAELGVVAEVRRSCWSLELLMKLALGSNHSEVTIDGHTMTSTPTPGGPPRIDVTDAGLLAQQSNIGTFNNDEFAVIPELGITLARDIRPNLRATIGYTFIYWSQVARPGDQIDTQLNLSQLAPGGLVGLARPSFPWVVTDVWAQGLSFGLDYRF